MAETVGVGNRAKYYDKYGAMRDMLQNHLLQLLCLVAMEPPARFNADQVRNEKLRVLTPSVLLKLMTLFSASMMNILAK